MKPKALIITLTATTVINQAIFACAGSGSQIIGSLCVTAANYCPKDFLKADGQMVSIRDYAALYAVVGVVYGDYNGTHFTIPDMRGRMPVGVALGGTLGTPEINVTLGQKRGSESVELTKSQIPAHTHPISSYGISNNIIMPQTEIPVTIRVRHDEGNVSMPSANGSYSLAGVKVGTSSVLGPYDTNTSLPNDAAKIVGASIETKDFFAGPNEANTTQQKINIIPPQLGLTWCISYKGLYPERDYMFSPIKSKKNKKSVYFHKRKNKNTALVGKTKKYS